MHVILKSKIVRKNLLAIPAVLFVLLVGYEPVLAKKLPVGHEGISFGMSERDVALKGYEKADNVHHFSYGEHFEEQPNVYVKKKDKYNVEVYLFKKNVYKIFIIYNAKEKDKKKLYENMIEENIKVFGKPSQTFEENVFGLNLLHNIWVDDKSIMDIRKGAGFIFKVLMDKKVKKEKELLKRRDEGI